MSQERYTHEKAKANPRYWIRVKDIVEDAPDDLYAQIPDQNIVDEICLKHFYTPSLKGDDTRLQPNLEQCSEVNVCFKNHMLS